MSKYDKIGIGYSNKRKSDPYIESQIHAQLHGACRILNIGAGTGSYEPKGIELVALEPSSEMISQRSESAHPVIQGVAEELPFDDKSFSHAMTVLSMHHWTDIDQAFSEIKRVTKESFVAMTWNPASPPFWFTADYFTEVFEKDIINFPSLSQFEKHFTKVKVSPLLIPHDCTDGFLAAYWRRPEAFFDPEVRQSISAFSTLSNTHIGLHKLDQDLKSGAWHKKHKDITQKEYFDAGYVIVEAKI